MNNLFSLGNQPTSNPHLSLFLSQKMKNEGKNDKRRTKGGTAILHPQQKIS
jgi:hypothetical protein